MPSQLFSEGKLGEPKEEIRNLNGFEYRLVWATLKSIASSAILDL
jgi:hypothetical protein